MSDLQPVDLYVTVEIWQHEDGSLGWRLKSNLDETVDGEVLTSALREVSQEVQACFQRSPILISLMIHQDGIAMLDRHNRVDFTSLSSFLSIREAFESSARVIHTGKVRKTSHWKYLWWTLEWYVSRLFRGRQKVPSSQAPTPPAPGPDALSEQSTGAQNGSVKAGGNVVVLHPRRLNPTHD